MIDPKDLERFWSKVDRRGDDECWPWRAFRNWQGYGTLKWPTGSRSDPIRGAHRVSYEVAHGPIPDGLLVLHGCDNPSCVNPRHLHLGDYVQNAREMVERGRSGPANYPERMKRGTEHHWTRLNPELVQTIYALSDAKLRQREIGERLGLAQTTVSGVVNGYSWKPLWREWRASRQAASATSSRK